MRTFLISLLALVVGCSAQSNTGIFADVNVEQVAKGLKFTEGPVWIKAGYWLFSDIPANHIYKLVPGGKPEVWRADSGNSNGLTLDKQGRLIACEHGNRRVTRTEPDGTITVIADTFDGKRFNSPNDVTVRSDGTIFFTDPTYGLAKRPQEIPFKGVYLVVPGQQPVVLFRDFDMPNGIVFSPNERYLYVADTPRNHIRRFDVAPDGSLVGGQIFVRVPNPDGIRMDTKGNLYVTSKRGVVAFAPNGKELGVITCPEVPANCAFGGKDGRTMLITARKGIYTVRLPIPGIVPGKTEAE
jgi:gluconolactonase